jgi:hypothetical protein
MRIYTFIKRVSTSDILPGVFHNQSGLKEEPRSEDGVNLFNNSSRASFKTILLHDGSRRPTMPVIPAVE